ncbi:hypothetical protein EIP86_001564 [Pleurotus ostreatoroseus]|nr:hypothetical protein EIP86_001564 [Pleurotus ostreatoroseus]
MSEHMSPSVDDHEGSKRTPEPTITSLDWIADRHESEEGWGSESEATLVSVSDHVAYNEQEPLGSLVHMSFQSVPSDGAELPVPCDLDEDSELPYDSASEDSHSYDHYLSPASFESSLDFPEDISDQPSYSSSDVCFALQRLAIDEDLVAAHDADGITHFEDMRLVGPNLECVNTSPALDQNPHAPSGSTADEDINSLLDPLAPAMPALLTYDSPTASKLYKLGSAPPDRRKRTKCHRRASSSGSVEVKQILIGRDAWKPQAVIGQGTYGRVYRLANRITGTQLAMKVIDIGHPMDRILWDGLVNELLVLDTLAQCGPFPYLLCPTTERAWGWRTSDNFLCMLTDYCPGGQLSEYRGKIPNGACLRQILAELVVGINTLHRLNIVHHDLKPENILIDADGHCVIADYGGAKFMDKDGIISLNITDDVLCTPNYIAPEVLSDDCDENGVKWYDYTVDWWALGCIIMTLTTGRMYFRGKNLVELMMEIPYRVQYVRETLKECGCSEILADLVEGLLTLDPNKRFLVEDIMEHPYFESV